MNSKFKISIPKPCHEDWNKMTPNEKGKFCNSCSKTVVDFTNKSTEEIEEYLVSHQHQRVCGHFYKKQLDSIVIEIPQIALEEQLSFQKLFILVLFIVMGTTLFSCQYSNGQKQKIDEIIILDSVSKDKKDSKKDSLKRDTFKKIENILLPTPKNVGVVDCKLNSKNDTIIDIIETLGELTVEGDIKLKEFEDDEIIMGMTIQQHPKFIEDKELPEQEGKENFNNRIEKFFSENFDSNFFDSLNLKKGKYKNFIQFVININGDSEEIKIKTPHPKIETEIRKIFEKLPQFIPGKQNGRAVKTKYTLPISFIIE